VKPGEPARAAGTVSRPRATRKHLTSPRRAAVGHIECRRVGGAIVLLNRGGKTLVAMMLDTYGRWTCPKGQIEQGEIAEEAAIREAEEELGLRGLRLLGGAGRGRYRFREGTKEIAAVVDWFALIAPTPQRFRKSREVVEAEWVDLEEAVRRAGYSNVRLTLRKIGRLLPLMKEEGRHMEK